MRPKIRTRRAITLFSTVRLVGVCAAASAVAFGSFALSRPTAGSAHILAVRNMQPLTAAETAVTLSRIGLGPEPLAAAGLSVLQVENLVAAVKSELQESIASLRAADEAYSTARRGRDRLTALVQSGRSTQQDREALATATSQLLTATTTRDAILDSLFGIGLDVPMEQPQRAMLVQIRANGAWDLPIQHRTVQQSEADWLRLRNALADVRTAELLGLEPTSAAQQILSTQNNVGSVYDATQNLQNLETVTSAWNEAVAG